MKTLILVCRVQFLIAVLLICEPRSANGQEHSEATNNVPLIQVNDAPLYQIIDLLARQSGINYIFDPRTSADAAPLVNFSWTNITARAALDRLLKEHDLELIENPSTTVARIAPRNLHVKPVNPALVGNDTNNAIPIVQMRDAPLDQAIKSLAGQARLKITFDEGLFKDPDSRPFQLPVVSIRWQNLTPRQALIALLDCYELTLVEGPDTATIQIKSKARIGAASIPAKTNER